MQKTSDYQRLLYACTQEGCSLCRIAQENTHRYLDAWQYDLFTDVEIREELRRTQGFCHDHTWQLVRMGANLQLAQAYRDILSDAAEQLQAVGTEASQSGGLLRRIFETKRERPLCPACRQYEQAEIRLVNMLRKALLDPTFYFSRQLQFDVTVARLKQFASDHPRFMFSADSRSAVLPYLTRAASVLHLPRPHWQYMGLFQRVARAIG